MRATRENWKDIEKYFSRTYVKFTEFPEEIFFIDRVDKNRIYAEDQKGDEFHILLENEYDLDYVLPQKTTYQLGNHACILNRIPARQWKRGICKENTTLVKINTQGGQAPMSLTFEALKGFVNKPKHFDFIEIAQSFDHGNMMDSYAVTPRMCISRNGLMFIDGIVCGHFNAPKKKMIIDKLLSKDIKNILFMKKEDKFFEVVEA